MSYESMAPRSEGLIDGALDWACFLGVGAYLGGVFTYLRLTGRARPAKPLAGIVSGLLVERLAALRPAARTGPLSEIESVGGFGFLARLPVLETDDLGTSRLRLLEEGRPLGPAHAPPADVKLLGGGRFSHSGLTFRAPQAPRPLRWTKFCTLLLFSSSDGSDPRTNGRSYTYDVD